MDSELKAKWIEALRSGEFQQGQNKLYDSETNSFCCLGVLCKVIGAKFADTVIERDEGYVSINRAPVLDGRPLVSDDGEELSDAFCKEVGIPNQADLIALNDGLGKEGDANYQEPQTFPAIADYIEANL